MTGGTRRGLRCAYPGDAGLAWHAWRTARAPEDLAEACSESVSSPWSCPDAARWRPRYARAWPGSRRACGRRRGREEPCSTEASRHLIDAGGKRFRATLVLLAAQFGDPADERVVPAAVAIELTHLATLYHDDVMDEATVRRGHAERQLPLGQHGRDPHR